MTDYPMVSCVMPTRNRRRFTPRAIDMFNAQTWPNKELIILEDGDESTAEPTNNDPPDGTTQRHGSVTKKDLSPGWLLAHRDSIEISWLVANLSVRYYEFTGTIGAKLNKGADAAEGDIILRWDDDDWNSPTRIADQVAHMRLSGKPVVGMSSLIYYREGDAHGWEYTGDAWYASGSTHCYTREWALNHPYPDLSLNEDGAFWEKAQREHAISTISGLTSLVACDHANNTSPRASSGDEFLREHSENFKKIPLSHFAATIGGHLLAAAA